MKDLVRPGKVVEEETLYRVKKQGELLEAYHIVVFTKDKTIPSQVKLSGKVFCYPTRSASKPSFFIDAFRLGSEICERESIDLVYTQDCFVTGLVGYLLKRKYNIPLCLCIHGDMIDNPYWINEKLLNRFFNILGKWLIKRADTLRVVSKSEMEKLIRMGIPKEKIWNIGCTVKIHEFLKADGAPIRSRYLVNNGKSKILLFIGRFTEQKDIPTLLKALTIILRSHPEAVLLLLGQGYLQAKLEKMAHELGIEKDVVFVGSVPHEDIFAYYAACDLFLLSSVYEGKARVLEEASAAAKPVVATDVSGTRDIIIDGVTGFVVDKGRPHDLAKRAIQLLDNPEMATEMGLKAREHILRLYSETGLLAIHKDMWGKTVSRYNNREITKPK
ncbi:MAG: glycosyltransferase [Candidatus Brocadiaceae bacterium]|nr:glycosyltransferase [Candidatus Brocadiaceae bacterium]